MIDEHDVREMLHRRGDTVLTMTIDTPTAVRRSRRRLLVNGVVTTVAAAAIAVATFAGVDAIRSAPIPADEPTPTGIFAPVAGRIVYENIGSDSGYAPGLWAVDPNGPSDTVPGPSVADDVASTLVPLELDGEPLGWSSDGTELLLMRSVGDGLFPEQYLSILHADGSETRLSKGPMGISGATISPDGTRVVFAGQYELSGLYVVDAQGGRPVPLPIPQATEGASDPTFSPDGTQIAYLAGNGEAEVWVANADGTDAHEILADEPTVFRGITGLEWSQAGDRLAIGAGTHERSGGSIYTLAPDGSDFTKVIVGGSSPSWSPDGSQIAYTSPAGLAIADADGSNVRAFGFAASGPWHPAGVDAIRAAQPPIPADPPEEPSVDLGIFAPIAGRIAYSSDGSLWAVDPSAPSPASTVVRLDLPGSGGAVGWSRDGTKLLFSREDPTDDRFPYDSHLYIVHADGTETQVVPEPISAAALSPDGTQVVYAADRSDGLYVVDAEGGQPVRISAFGEEPTFSPDGTQIAFLGLPRSGCCVPDEREHVWVVNADGTDAHEILVNEPALDDGANGLTWSPVDDRIAMDNAREGHVAIYTFASDGSGFTQVVTGGANPFWSPDGSQIAYEVLDGSLDGLRILDADGVRIVGVGRPGPWHPGTPEDGAGG
jgi:Tol biopolymer transport system component